MLSRAVFLDKDGTLIEDVPYNVDPERIRLAAGVPAGLRALARAGYRLIVVSNQSGVARGYFPERALVAVEDRLRQLFAEAGTALDGFYYCPHHRDGAVTASTGDARNKYAIACDCRKPAPGLLRRAAADHRLQLEQCWLIGDILDDVEAGTRAGCRTVLLDNGGETEWRRTPLRQPTSIVPDFAAAARAIVRDAGACS